MSDYVELRARSAFSFLRGTSQPEDLVAAAGGLGLGGLAVCDRDGVYGSARVHAAARKVGVRPIVGAELTMEGGGVLPVLVKDRTGYRNLCQLITRAKLRGTKTECAVRWGELGGFASGLVALVGGRADAAGLDGVVGAFGKEDVCVEVRRHLLRGEDRRNELLVELARSRGVRVVATNGVVYATPERRQVLDVFTCIRNHTHLDQAGRLLSANSERHLKSGKAMERLFPDLPEAISNTARVAERCEFTLENLGYEFPTLDVPDGQTMASWLRVQAYEGARRRYGTIPEVVRRQLERELDLIIDLKFSGYFLIVWDLVNFCRDENILVQGRGSAANSVVCYCLGITACDPIKHKLLFERFLSESRKSWPDIDLDLPSGDRRERVIQEVYRRYGKHGAAMTANVITYRGRSAMREIGKALNFPPEILDRFSRLHAAGDFPHTLELRDQLRQAGLPVSHARSEAAVRLYQQMRGLPRHLGQHSGGMIICRDALSSVVPLENASMPGRVVAQWDKDDCEDLGIVKVDLLGLGMMAVMQDSLEMCRERRGDVADMAAIPPDDAQTYDLMCAADTVGTFQVESRAQMATLPKLKPRCFYDVVIQVAVIRPGPIQGGMLHPLFARRAGEPFEHIHPLLADTLERTYGVPLFQEQLLKMAMVMADFTGGEAEELRRALSFHRSHEKMDKVCVKLKAAMVAKGIEERVVEEIVKSVQSFAVYGFPESHAISFALIAYASCWLKTHRAPEFYCALLNNQPMGFYSAATLVQDAKARGIKVRPVSVLTSGWRCGVDADDGVRLGLCVVRGMSEVEGERIVRERGVMAFTSVADFKVRTGLAKDGLRNLARIGALNGLAEHRRDGFWRVEEPVRVGDLFLEVEGEGGARGPLEAMGAGERLGADFAGMGMTTGAHPMALVRDKFPEIWRAGDLVEAGQNDDVWIGGMVICRQRPGTAKGYVFISVEDETGVANAILEPELFEERRLCVTQERFLRIRGVVQRSKDGVILVKARVVEGMRYGEALAAPVSHDFH